MADGMFDSGGGGGWDGGSSYRGGGGGVGVLVENCARTARDAVREINEQWQEDQSKPEKTEIKIGVCGEHGGDPASVRYFASERVALDYVSCSAHRVVSARLAAAQAAARSLGA